MTSNSPASVYRLWDAEGRLLYVGCSSNVERRIEQHKSGKHWAAEITRYTAEEFPTHDEALKAESAAIHSENPKYNGCLPWLPRPVSARLCHTIPEFCNAARISRSLFYALQRKGTGPRVTRLGDRSFVSVDEARNWIEQMTVPSGSRQPEAQAA